MWWIYGANFHAERLKNAAKASATIQDSKESYIRKLLRYKNNGVSIYIDGKKSSTQDLLRMLKISEHNQKYMGDYIADRNCKILKEIRFEKIKD